MLDNRKDTVIKNYIIRILWLQKTHIILVFTQLTFLNIITICYNKHLNISGFPRLFKAKWEYHKTGLDPIVLKGVIRKLHTIPFLTNYTHLERKNKTMILVNQTWC